MLCDDRNNLIDADYVGVKQAERHTGISRWTWRRWAYSGRISSVKAGSRLLIPMSEIRRLIAEGTRPRLEVSGNSGAV